MSATPRPTSPAATAAAALQVVQIGDSLGVILPRKMLAHMQAGCDDMLYATPLPDGVALRTHDPAFDKPMALAREVMQEYHGVLRKLAQ
ncbi:MAG: AbrB/MazE/SpoVT family DNA-binding domain-containing protein [Pseudomonadota bacterium]|nr:AbrB/MazE/SpoVT family DNA-binding domain-containing protein [Pseudomonadota bacterium]